jgi:hypothetical protein
LLRQRDNQRERQANKAALRPDRIMMLKNRPLALESSSSEDETSLRVEPPAARERVQTRTRQREKATTVLPSSVHVRAIFGRPLLSKTATNNSYRWTRVCNVCDKPDPQGNCEGSPTCLMPNNRSFSHLGRQDMRVSNDAVGTGVGKDWGCFQCKEKGHFARDCPTMSDTERVARDTDPMFLQALAARSKRLQD